MAKTTKTAAKTIKFELKDVGAHLHMIKSEAPAKGTPCVIRIGKTASYCEVKFIQKLKDTSKVGVWIFPAYKGQGVALVEARGQMASLSIGEAHPAEFLEAKAKRAKVKPDAKPVKTVKAAPKATKTAKKAKKAKIASITPDMVNEALKDQGDVK